jgi:EAL domain-containing protein (putative c-di-GMP-specific phosphodiesterase class I)
MKIGEWVLKTAIRQLEIWKQQGLETKVSVNVSGPHLQTNGFVQFLIDLLDKHPEVSPLCLELEILETAALEDIGKVANVFNECRKLGVSFALDDFGTGYSSLTYFRRLPADLLKIDQSFVRGMLDDPDDLAIVEGVIGLTKAFDRHVIAEGVETPEHGMVLLNLGCDQAQGYGIARPMPADEFPAWAKAFVAHDLWNSVTAFRWSRDDLPLLLAEFEHRRWIESLQLFLDTPEGGDGGLLPPTFDVHDCRFGRWYYGKAQSRYRHIGQFVDIEAIHDAVHQIGLQMIEAKTLGDSVERLASLKLEMQAQTALLMEGLQTIQTEVLLSRVTVH